MSGDDVRMFSVTLSGTMTIAEVSLRRMKHALAIAAQSALSLSPQAAPCGGPGAGTNEIISANVSKIKTRVFIAVRL